MKKLLVILCLTLSSQSFAFEQPEMERIGRVLMSLAFTSSPILTTNGLTASVSGHRKEATMVLQDIQEYNHTGSISIYLADKMNIVRNEMTDISDSEAIDVLADLATDILK